MNFFKGCAKHDPRESDMLCKCGKLGMPLWDQRSRKWKKGMLKKYHPKMNGDIVYLKDFIWFLSLLHVPILTKNPIQNWLSVLQYYLVVSCSQEDGVYWFLNETTYKWSPDFVKLFLLAVAGFTQTLAPALTLTNNR